MDDLTLYRLADDRFMLTVNASNIDKDWAWVTAHGGDASQWKNVSAETALLAVQGPKAESLVQRLADRDVTRVPVLPFRAAARWRECPRSSRAPATPARTASSSTLPRARAEASGTR